MANKMQISYNKWQDPTMLKNTKCILISWELKSVEKKQSLDSQCRSRSLFLIPRLGRTTSNPVEILFGTLRNCQHYPALDLLLHLQTYIFYKCFEQWNMSQRIKNVMNDSTIAKVNQQSEQAFFYQVQQTGLSMGCYYCHWN